MGLILKRCSDYNDALQAHSRFGVAALSFRRSLVDVFNPLHTLAKGFSTVSDPGPIEKVVLYRGRGMRLFRQLVRLKLIQLAGVAALAIPITLYMRGEEVTGLQTVIATGLVVGSGVASTALWYYSRRYIGELSLIQNNSRIRLSVLDFWGSREDNDVCIADLIPPLLGRSPQAAAAILAEPLIPLDVEGDRQYFLSVKYGILEDKEKLRKLLEGRYAGQQPPQSR